MKSCLTSLWFWFKCLTVERFRQSSVDSVIHPRRHQPEEIVKGKNVIESQDYEYLGIWRAAPARWKPLSEGNLTLNVFFFANVSNSECWWFPCASRQFSTSRDNSPWPSESGGLRRGQKVSAWRCTRRRNPSRYTLPTIRQFLTEDRCIQIQKIIISRTHRHPKFRIYLKIRFYSVQKISCTYPDPHLPTGRWVVILTERFLYTSSTSIQFKVNDSVAQQTLSWGVLV
jgi:hypothetical protein